MPIKVTVVPHDTSWASEYSRASKQVLNALDGAVVAIHHIGSTAISGIHAKPIIDILVETDSLSQIDARTARMTAIGYEAMGEFGLTGRRYFRMDNEDGIRTHHVHVFEANSDSVIRHLAFRDFMNAHPDYAQLYSLLKQELAAACNDDIEKYMDGKDPFIKKTEALAVKWWRKRSAI